MTSQEPNNTHLRVLAHVNKLIEQHPQAEQLRTTLNTISQFDIPSPELKKA